jgi:ATP/ADP translocase
MQSVRDAMIVTSCGAEALPLISAFGVLPASVLFIMYYDKLVSDCNNRVLQTLLEPCSEHFMRASVCLHFDWLSAWVRSAHPGVSINRPHV